MNKTKAIIFDMSGVLTDSEWFIAEAARLMFKETYDTDIVHEDFSPFAGLGENYFLEEVAKKYDIKNFDIERDKERTDEIYTELVKKPEAVTALPGSIEFIYQCRKLGLKTALAASIDRVKMTANLEAIGLINQKIWSDNIGLAAAIEAAARNKAFDAMVNGMDVERQKPHPDLFLEAASRLEEEPSACWVIENSPNGIEAARAAGMRCLAILTTFPKGRIKAAKPDKIAKNLGAIHPEELLKGRI